MSTFLVASVEPDASPPMTPPSPSGPLSSAITHIVLVDGVLAAVEAHERLAVLAEARAHRALELVGVIDMQRPAAILADVVRHVDQRIDRPQPDRLEPRLQPVRRRAVRRRP